MSIYGNCYFILTLLGVCATKQLTFLFFNILCNVAINKYTKKRTPFNMANYDEMTTDLAHINWEDEFRLCKDNVNDQWEILKTILHTLEDKYVLQKEVSSNGKGNFPLKTLTPES